MFALARFFLALFSSLFKSKSRLEAENAPFDVNRVHFTNSDRLFLIQLYRWFPSVLKVITIIRPVLTELLTCPWRANFARSHGPDRQVADDLAASFA
jgi:hypothetical protein